MTLPTHKDPIDIPAGARIVRPDPVRPFVAMSNRKRWSKCALSAVLPQLKTASGPAAEEGTAAHIVGEFELARAFNPEHPGILTMPNPPAGLDAFDYSPRGIADWQTQVRDHARTYGTKAAALFADCSTPTTVMIEHKIENVTIHGVRVFTVADAILWNEGANRLVVGDYKYGRGPVGMGTIDEPNEQVAGTIALAVSVIPDIAPDATVGGFVYQPRTLFGEPWQVLAPLTSKWAYEQRHKLDRELAAVSAAAANPNDTAPTPGEHCKYCPSARWCPAAAAFGDAAVSVEQGKRAIVDLSESEVMALWSARSAFKQFEDDLKERVKMLAENASAAVSIKRRAGNSVWASPASVVETLMLHDRADLLQPPGIEKVRAAGIPDETLKPLISRAPDVLTYVSVAGKDLDTASAAFAKYLPKGAK